MQTCTPDLCRKIRASFSSMFRSRLLPRKFRQTSLAFSYLLSFACAVSFFFLICTKQGFDFLRLRQYAQKSATSKTVHVQLSFEQVSSNALIQSSKTAYLDRAIDLTNLRKQRLKPWHDVTILGGEICPGIGSEDVKKHKGSKTDVGQECPRFTECRGDLPQLAFCKNKKLFEKSGYPIHPPRHLNGKHFRGLVHCRTTLPWDGDIVSFKDGIYVNHFGQVFDENTQYLHGGCQVIDWRKNEIRR